MLTFVKPIAILAALAAAPAFADPLTDRVIDGHILPGYSQLATATQALEQAAAADCTPDSPALRTAYGAAMDAWVDVSHLRFGPSEVDNRAFALAFWPDSRSKTPKGLSALFAAEDPSVATPEAFKTASIAVRGLYPLEFLLFDPDYAERAASPYGCAAIRAMARDSAANASALLADWQAHYAREMRQPGDIYRSDAEVHRELFKALNTGLEMLSEMRLGRPLGTFDKPRPKRAEMRRAGRSLHHVERQLAALEQLALLLSADDTALAEAFTSAFTRADRHAAQLAEDPVFAGVTDPAQRFKIEALQQEVREIHTIATEQLGPRLGVEAGFNALDGD